MLRKAKRWILWSSIVLILLIVGGGMWVKAELSPTSRATPFYTRFEVETTLEDALNVLQSKRVIRNPLIMMQYARYRKAPRIVEAGTYRMSPGDSADQVLQSLRKRIKQMVRLPEGWWINRTAAILEEKAVCTREEYSSSADNSRSFRRYVSFDLPKRNSLEGYLFPDTYDLPPLLGADAVIRRQLRAFQEKVIPVLSQGADIDRCVIIGSMIEAEVAVPEERPIVASVIENRLALKMPLQIDATVLYALQEWKQLRPGEVKSVESPYNTYLYKGLPPGPICSPSVASILAAAKPKKTKYLYYVARSNGKHYFSITYSEHLANIRRARSEAKP